MNCKHLYYQKKLCFLHKMLRLDNSIVASVMKFFIHCDEYVKLCDYADTTSRDNIHTIKRRINSLQNVMCNHVNCSLRFIMF